ncbi:RHS repeat domain-containing protein [Pseudomonas sp. TMB3-21]
MPDQLQAHSASPTLTVSDPRGLIARSVHYYRAGPADDAEIRVDRTVHDAAGRTLEQWDPRVFECASAAANLINIYSLSKAILASNSVDAGMRLSLAGEAGQSAHEWDGRCSQRWMQYDKQLRLCELYEQAAGGGPVIAERLTYAANDQAFADHNQCGRLIRHEDSAGVLLFNDYGLNGAAIEQERRFTSQKTDGFVTHSRFSPSGELRAQTDARGNEKWFHQTLDGTLRAVDLRLEGTFEWLPMVRAVTYNAHGQVEKEVAGNGVITTLEYGPEDGRLKRLLSCLDTKATLQNLRYTYDPVGNVLSIEDAALPIRFFANQRIEPISRYRYDTLYRLVEATGWEASAVKHGPSASQTVDPAMPCNYRQTYRYDAGNNLLELTQVGAQDPGHRLVAEAHSNRCLPVRDGVEPSEQDFLNSFDANGNLLQLQPGQTLSWDVRNQLREVRPVERNGVDDDIERYEYGADGMRVRKVRSLLTGSQTNLIETCYLPGLQIRTHSGTSEELHIIEVSIGRGSVRVLHWKAGKPKDIPNNQQRYSLTDHLGSSTLELDQDANVITQERYYPFGGTAWSSGEAVQVSYKTVRYSGKEQDATGLYYYGFRFYVPWVQRWLNPDPAGTIDGLNVFAFISGNPLRFIDADGLDAIDVGNLTNSQENALGLYGGWIRPSRNPARYPDPRKKSSRLVNVSDEIFISLKDAQLSNLITKSIIYKGSENQRLDLWRTGENLNLVMSLVRPDPSAYASLSSIQEYGVGNCGEHASVNFHLLASTETKRPVFRVGAANDIDHSFVVIGDPRGTPRSELVVADAWPFFPLAHTADHGQFGIGTIFEQAGANADPKYAVDGALLEQHSAMTFPVLNKSNQEDRQFFEWIQKKPKTYVQVYSRENEYIGVDYVNGEGAQRGSHLLPESYVDERMAHYKSYLK